MKNKNKSMGPKSMKFLSFGPTFVGAKQIGCKLHLVKIWKQGVGFLFFGHSESDSSGPLTLLLEAAEKYFDLFM